MRFVPALDKEVPYPSAARSEIGTIESVEIYSRSDKRTFSLDQAIAWLSNSACVSCGSNCGALGRVQWRFPVALTPMRWPPLRCALCPSRHSC